MQGVFFDFLKKTQGIDEGGKKEAPAGQVLLMAED